MNRIITADVTAAARLTPTKYASTVGRVSDKQKGVPLYSQEREPRPACDATDGVSGTLTGVSDWATLLLRDYANSRVRLLRNTFLLGAPAVRQNGTPKPPWL